MSKAIEEAFKAGRKEVIDNLEEWANYIGEHTLVTVRTVINTLKLKEKEQ